MNTETLIANLSNLRALLGYLMPAVPDHHDQIRSELSTLDDMMSILLQTKDGVMEAMISSPMAKQLMDSKALAEEPLSVKRVKPQDFFDVYRGLALDCSVVASKDAGEVVLVIPEVRPLPGGGVAFRVHFDKECSMCSTSYGCKVVGHSKEWCPRRHGIQVAMPNWGMTQSGEMIQNMMDELYRAVAAQL